MNKQRKALIENLADQLSIIKGGLEDIHSEEEEYFDNMPESIQGGEKGETAQSNVDMLDEAIQSIESAIDNLNSI
jgi:hypothetical protein